MEEDPSPQKMSVQGGPALTKNGKEGGWGGVGGVDPSQKKKRVSLRGAGG